MTTDARSPDAEPGDDPLRDDLVAYLDGELDGKTQQAIEVKLALDANVRAEAESLRRVWDLLDYLPKAEPSSSFTERTLERLAPLTQAAPKVTHAVPTQPSPIVQAHAPNTQPMIVPLSWSRRASLVLSMMAASIFAVVVGYYLRERLLPPVANAPAPVKDPDALPLGDFRVIENLPLYRSVGDFAYLLQLEESQLFAANVDGRAELDDDKPLPGDIDRTTILRANLAAFEALPAERQQELRRLDQQLHEQPPLVQGRLMQLMEEYARWVNRLPAPERDSIRQATLTQRITLVREQLESQFIASLPIALRQRLEQEPMRRAELLAEFRQNEQTWREDWLLVKRNWDELKKSTFVLPFQDDQFVTELETYLKNLGPQLTSAEQNELRKASQQGNLVRYARKVLEMSDKHPLLPGPADGPRQFDQLPLDVRAFLDQHGIASVKATTFPGVGRWPDYAIEVTKAVRERGLKLPREFGPTQPSDFTTPEMKALFAKIDERLKSKRDRDTWLDQQGRWPEFPKAIITASKRFNLPIPGYTLPGPAEKWDKMRVKKKT